MRVAQGWRYGDACACDLALSRVRGRSSGGVPPVPAPAPAVGGEEEVWPDIGEGPVGRVWGGTDAGTATRAGAGARAASAEEIPFGTTRTAAGWVYLTGAMGPFVEDGGYEDARVSPWHDVGLRVGGGAGPGVVRCVVEAAAGGDGAGGRVDLRVDGNPLVPCAHAPEGPRPFALGVLPQTFENPKVEDRFGPGAGTGLRGDEDLLRAVVLGSAASGWTVGEVRAVRAVTAVGFADRARGMRAWTVVCVDPEDAVVGGARDATGLEAAAGPGSLDAVRAFAGWGELESLGGPLDPQGTLECVDRSHREWVALVAGYWASLSDTYAMWTTQPAGHWSRESGRWDGGSDSDDPHATPVRRPRATRGGDAHDNTHGRI